MYLVGHEGQVSLGESPDGETRFTTLKGLVFGRGFASELFLPNEIA